MTRWNLFEAYKLLGRNNRLRYPFLQKDCTTLLDTPEMDHQVLANQFNMGQWKLHLLLSCMGALLSLLCVEMLLWFQPYKTFGSARELYWIREKVQDPVNYYTIDNEFGFRPRLGNNFYSTYGTKVNNYTLEKRAGYTRLLFMGDSVTDCGHIITGLRIVYGEDKFEYWNAGVGSFGTVQEVNYYKKYNYQIRPDHVILTFHHNDFETTPVAFLNSDNRLVVFAPNAPVTISKFWFQHSMFYRAIVAMLMNFDNKYRFQAGETFDKEVTESLKELKTLLSANGTRLSVLINPIWLPSTEWTQFHRDTNHRIIKLLLSLDIRFFDLSAVPDQLAADGVEMQDGDIWHPSGEAGLYSARYLFERNLL